MNCNSNINNPVCTFKTVSPQALVAAYDSLFPKEGLTAQQAERTRILENWLTRYQHHPDQAIATTNWGGKATASLFYALGIKQPKTKGLMLSALQVPSG